MILGQVRECFFKRVEEVAFRGRSQNEKKANIIHNLRGQFKLKDLLKYTGMPKATFMYWQKRFNRKNPDQEIELNTFFVRNFFYVKD